MFGDYEHYAQTNMALAPGSTTVPTAKMLNDDFSEPLNFNRHGLAGPDTWPGTSDFGQIAGTSGTPRVIQLGARVEW